MEVGERVDQPTGTLALMSDMHGVQASKALVFETSYEAALKVDTRTFGGKSCSPRH